MILSTVLWKCLVVDIINDCITITKPHQFIIFVYYQSLSLAVSSKEVTQKSKVFTDYGHSFTFLWWKWKDLKVGTMSDSVVDESMCQLPVSATTQQVLSPNATVNSFKLKSYILLLFSTIFVLIIWEFTLTSQLFQGQTPNSCGLPPK